MPHPPITINNVSFTFPPDTFGFDQFTQNEYTKIDNSLTVLSQLAPTLFSVTRSITFGKKQATDSRGIANTGGQGGIFAIGIHQAWLDQVGQTAGPGFIDSTGNRRILTLDRALANELYDLANGPGDISLQDYLNVLRGGASSSPTVVGSDVSFENSVYPSQRMDQLNAYQGELFESSDGTSPDLVAFRARSSFTDGKSIDLVLHDSITTDGIGAETQGIDTRPYTGKPKDLIFGYLGNDKIQSGSGDDFIYGGVGNDTLLGGSDKDAIYGDNGEGAGAAIGNDHLFAADWSGAIPSGAPTVTDGEKWLDGVTDRLEGGPGNDTYYVGAASIGISEYSFTVWVGAGGQVNSEIYAFLDQVKDSQGSDVVYAYSGQKGFAWSGSTWDQYWPDEVAQSVGTYTFISDLSDRLGLNYLVWGSGASGGTVHNTAVIYDIASDKYVLVQNFDENFDIQPVPLVELLDFSWGQFGISNGGLPPSGPTTPPSSPPTPGTPPTKSGSPGSDIIEGTSGGDIIAAGSGDDIFRARDGDDVVRPGSGRDVIYGGEGYDFVDYSSSLSGINIDLANAIDQSGGDAAGDIIVSIEGVIASNNADTIRGDGSANYILGGMGNDILDGREGNDILLGEGGNDSLIGASGNDAFEGGGGNDTLVGGAGADSLIGGTGTDIAEYIGSTGIVVDLAVPSNATGDALGDTFSSIEWFWLTSGNDTFTGSTGKDRVDGRLGNDTLKGGAGDDALIGGAGADSLDGGDGEDVASYSGSSALVLDRITVANSTGDAAGDVLANVEQFVLTSGADTFRGSGQWETVDGDAGNDTLLAGSGNDKIIGGAGSDQIDGGTGTDTASYETSLSGLTLDLVTAANSTGDAAGDTFVSIEWFELSAGNDTFVGSNTKNRVKAGAGNDILTGGSDDDTLMGEAGADVINGGAGYDTVAYDTSAAGVVVNIAAPGSSSGDAAGDTFSNIEKFRLTALNDQLFGGTAAESIDGDAGNDWIVGGGGNDDLYGGLGNDTFAFATGFGKDKIYDFKATAGEVDVVEFSTVVFASYGAMQSAMAQVGADVVITVDSATSLTLKSVTMAGLSSADFRYV